MTTDIFGWLITAAISGVCIYFRKDQAVKHFDRKILELKAAKLLDRCVVAMRAELGELFDSELVRVHYFEADDFSPWCVRIGTVDGKCVDFEGCSTDAAFNFFAASLPAMAKVVREKHVKQEWES
jgi:hypothetical protein